MHFKGILQRNATKTGRRTSDASKCTKTAAPCSESHEKRSRSAKAMQSSTSGISLAKMEFLACALASQNAAPLTWQWRCRAGPPAKLHSASTSSRSSLEYLHEKHHSSHCECPASLEVHANVFQLKQTMENSISQKLVNEFQMVAWVAPHAYVPCSTWSNSMGSCGSI
jgi:hypothetical protein